MSYMQVICFMITSGVCIQKFYSCIVKTQSHAFYPVQERFCILIFVKFLCIGTIKLKFKTSKFISFDLSTAVA